MFIFFLILLRRPTRIEFGDTPPILMVFLKIINNGYSQLVSYDAHVKDRKSTFVKFADNGNIFCQQLQLRVNSNHKLVNTIMQYATIAK